MSTTIRATLLGAAIVPATVALITGCSFDDENAASAPSTVTVTHSADDPRPSNDSSDGGDLPGPGSDIPGTDTTDDATPMVTTDQPGNPGTGFTVADPEAYRSGGSNVGDVAFVSPTGNIWCRLGAERYTAGCQAKYAPIPAGADCTGTDMYPLSTLSRGFFLQGDKVTPSCFNQGIFTSSERNVLAYGYSISDNGYTCYSRTTGITCKTPAGNGFVLSMQEARAF